MAPFDLSSLGTFGNVILFLGVGIAFGFILESSGFGDARKLAGQFYFTELTVLKVMFTAIIVAMVGLVWASAVGLVNFAAVFVNPTYLWPGIVGGLIMGVGFIVGGYCPGTSLVSLATLKKDGAMFVLGVGLGVFLFGETVGLYDGFFNSSDLGRFTLGEWLGLDAGIVAFGVVVMAIFMFWGGERIRKALHGKTQAADSSSNAWKLSAAAAGVLLLVAAPLLLVRQPTPLEKFDYMTDQNLRLAERQVQIDPGELLNTIGDDLTKLVMLDLRDEADWNRFHLLDAQRADLAGLEAAKDKLLNLPNNTIIVLMSQKEQRATKAWKLLTALGVSNAYILEGGIDAWLEAYSHGPIGAGDGLALGSRHPASHPDPHHAPVRSFKSKIKLVKKAAKGGGCG